jgi:FMN phosphatase YigB (HAD superfamily)
MGINKDIDVISTDLAIDNVCNDEKVVFYDDVLDKMSKLKSTYNISILSDTWPSLKRVLSNKKIAVFLDGIIMSCDYGICKNNVELFNIAAVTLNIEPQYTAFIDDSELNLQNAETAGFIPILMDRKRKKKVSKYPIANNMEDVIRIIEKHNKGINLAMEEN